MPPHETTPGRIRRRGRRAPCGLVLLLPLLGCAPVPAPGGTTAAAPSAPTQAIEITEEEARAFVMDVECRAFLAGDEPRRLAGYAPRFRWTRARGEAPDPHAIELEGEPALQALRDEPLRGGGIDAAECTEVGEGEPLHEVGSHLELLQREDPDPEELAALLNQAAARVRFRGVDPETTRVRVRFDLYYGSALMGVVRHEELALERDGEGALQIAERRTWLEAEPAESLGRSVDLREADALVDAVRPSGDPDCLVWALREAGRLAELYDLLRTAPEETRLQYASDYERAATAVGHGPEARALLASIDLRVRAEAALRAFASGPPAVCGSAIDDVASVQFVTRPAGMRECTDRDRTLLRDPGASDADRPFCGPRVDELRAALGAFTERFRRCERARTQPVQLWIGIGQDGTVDSVAASDSAVFPCTDEARPSLKVGEFRLRPGPGRMRPRPGEEPAPPGLMVQLEVRFQGDVPYEIVAPAGR